MPTLLFCPQAISIVGSSPFLVILGLDPRIQWVSPVFLDPRVKPEDDEERAEDDEERAEDDEGKK